MPRTLVPLFVLALVLLPEPRTARADAGDETLRHYLDRADLVLDATLTVLDGPIHREDGVAGYGASLEVHAVLQGRPPETDEPLRVGIERFERVDADRLPYLRQGARVVLFLDVRREGDVPRYETADFWFGVQPYSAWLVRRLAALGSPPGGPPAATRTVKAKHYRVVYAESGLELTHGGGRWVDEIYLPDAHVAAMLVFGYDQGDAAPGATVEIRPVARLFAFRAEKPRNDLTGLDGEPSVVEDVEIPADLARDIVALAGLSERGRAENRRLGAEVAARLGWKEIPARDR